MHALRCAAAVHFFSTFRALNKQKVTIVVFTIYMGIAWLSTLMAFAKNIFGYTLPDALIKELYKCAEDVNREVDEAGKPE